MTQTRKEALTALLEKVEAGERGDGLNTASCFDEPSDMNAVDAFDGSLDAAKALHEAVLPGWIWGLRSHADIEGDGYFAWVNSADFRVDHYHAGGEYRAKVMSGLRETGDAADPARALFIADLRALIAQEDKTDGI